jgi:LacI family transcriptional regulator
MEKRVSMKDVANKVGVSIALVSYVMNGLEKEKRVSVKVAKKIREAAAKLNYQPNQIARSLRKGSTNTIGLIVADIANPFFSQLARIIEHEAINFGFTVVFGSSDEDEFKSESLINTFLNRHVDGFIIVPTEGTNIQIQSLMRKNIPLVLIDRFFPEIKTSYIILDNYKATFSATSHLIEKGYKRIAMVAYKSSLIHMKERIRGYTEALDKFNMADNTCVKEVKFEKVQKDMEKILNNLLTKNKKIDSIILATNTLSISALYCLRKNNITIPNDLGFIGFDGGECFDLFSPRLTHVKQPLEEMGKEAFRVILDLINGSNKTSQIMLNSSLVICSSC